MLFGHVAMARGTYVRPLATVRLGTTFPTPTKRESRSDIAYGPIGGCPRLVLILRRMSQGFLGFDSSLMLDVVVCALVLVVPVIIYSLYLVKVRRNYALHATIQTTLAVVLLLVVTAFEVDMRLHGGWENIVNKHPEAPRVTGAALSQVRTMLWVHLVFAVSTPLLWITTLTLAWKRFAKPPQPGLHSRTHKTLGWLSTLDLVLTSVTGLGFYYLAFVR